ncbi:T9SS type A sorting domain-containing protein [Fibrella sp. HMF5335]|uniref:T9SS type A sorting domain-containing protein n=1 Tax=Fibrella rubiginis TaxID=2817060 RepID=A0A939GFJ1_9BACT|nr:T9SS type A sorting domain-containing protein [Fibrella rubiginis]MBO0936560.1 T9SS type A sorting domain-containing protein [Fibrella rubiginis]
MLLHVLRLLLALLLSVGCVSLYAQTTITTLPLSVSSVCAGTSLTVSFAQTGTVATGNVYTAQLSSGGDYTSLSGSTPPTFDATTGQYALQTTIPASVSAGGNYRVRVVASNPATVGSASSTTLTVRTPPGAPTLAAQLIAPNTYQYTFCQNDKAVVLSDLVNAAPDNYRIQYDVGNGLAPTAQKTFTPPTINPLLPGKALYNVRYVVIDDKKGCNPPEQSSSIAYLVVEIKPRPTLPSVASAAVAYCQNQPPTPLTASITTAGSEIVWYDPNGAVVSSTALSGTAATGASILPATAQTGTFVYQVVQSLDRCEGPRASVTVTVSPAAATPTTTTPRVELCRGAVASPLVATGTNLIWTDPNGVTSTAAPTPPTINVSKNADGDVYYVAQNNANGCISQRLAIRVVVQATPTLALTGSTTANLGQEVPVKLVFTGAGPYRFKLSNGFSGAAQRDTTILILPDKTTTYQVAEVSNSCGAGLPVSAVTITVLVPTIRTQGLSSSSLCAGASLLANFQTTGAFNPGNSFRLQMARPVADTANANYIELGNLLMGNGQISGTIPATATAGTYWVRVVATNPKIPINGSISPTLLTVQGTPTASLSATPTAVLAGETAKLSVLLGGSGPWTFAYRDSTDALGAVQTITTNTSPYVIDVKPLKTTTYKLTVLSNACGASTGTLARTVITVNPVLAVEPLGGSISAFPNPATASITVRIDPALLTQPATLELIDLAGLITHRQFTSQPTTILSLDGQAAGLLLLRVQAGGQAVTYRVMKL